MARDYQTTVDLLVQRVRQDGGVAVTDDFATLVLGKCERLLNAYLRRVKDTNTLTTSAEQLLYNYRAFLPEAVDILEVYDGVAQVYTPLMKCETLWELSAYDIDWFRKVDGTHFEIWCQIARDFLVIYPAKASSSSISVTYTKLVDVYTTYASASEEDMSLPDEDVETALALAEIILLARNRTLTQVAVRLQQFIPLLKDLGLMLAEDRK